MSSPSKKVVYFMTLSFAGHINPMCSLVHEVAKNPELDCVFYGIPEHKEKIEKTGARFRLYSNRNGADYEPGGLEDKDRNKKAMKYAMEVMETIPIQIQASVKDIEAEKPSLIVYDPSLIVARYLQEYLENKGTQVKFILFYPNFAIKKEMLKDATVNMKVDIHIVIGFFRLLLKQIGFKWDYGIPIVNLMTLTLGLERNLKIIAVFPELHPKSNEYDSKHKFVGQCASEEVRKYDLNDDPGLKSILDLFPIKENKVQSEQQDEELKLIYVSLGSVFHCNSSIFEKIIDAIRTYNVNPNRKMSSSQFRVVISAGEKGLEILNKKVSDGKLIMPNNILLRPQVPQLEILKRAHLFISHCGMNSTSETIMYAVPVVSIPLEADQHLNGKRICDELKLGVRLDALKLTVDIIADAIDEVLSDEKYTKNVQEMSAISAKYNGAVEGAKIITDFLNQIEADKLNPTMTKTNQVNPL